MEAVEYYIMQGENGEEYDSHRAHWESVNHENKEFNKLFTEHKEALEQFYKTQYGKKVLLKKVKKEEYNAFSFRKDKFVIDNAIEDIKTLIGRVNDSVLFVDVFTDEAKVYMSCPEVQFCQTIPFETLKGFHFCCKRLNEEFDAEIMFKD
ncbi:hypothetical protein M2325_000684 [Methanococcus voltae PS]|uniref:Uncharacterized protein n=1 Tax=Methanococcus voltae PS TaxID=523842 RepID=A0ABT2EWI7_METVO|nr:hypothetical protein [Methanococcus voltae]MCS3921999.1 hypothetical protein [Methanococcus voltae PS]